MRGCDFATVGQEAAVQIQSRLQQSIFRQIHNPKLGWIWHPAHSVQKMPTEFESVSFPSPTPCGPGEEAGMELRPARTSPGKKHPDTVSFKP